MKRNVFTDGNESGLVMIEGLGEYVPVAQLAELWQSIADHKQLTKELDKALNGDAAAEQASLCDLVAQVRSSESRTHIISPQVFEDALKERDQLKARIKWLEFQAMLSPDDPAAAQKTIEEHQAEIIDWFVDSYTEMTGTHSAELVDFKEQINSQLRQQAKEAQS